MSLSILSRLKKFSALGVAFFVALTISLSSLAVFAPQAVRAEARMQDMKFNYIVNGNNQLIVRGYLEDVAVAEWATTDFGVNFGPISFDKNAADKNGGPLSGSGDNDVSKASDLPNIFVGQRASDAELRGNGYPDIPIKIGHPEYVQAYRQCFEAGTPTTKCVGDKGEQIREEQAAEEDEDKKDEPTCESEGGDMSWVVCPVLGMFDSALEWLDRKIHIMLEVPESYLNDDLRATWGRLRNIAYIILVPIMLVMIISTALGFDFISAYTLKRAIPRLVIATIFIALSWEIATFLVTFTNVVGRGVMGLMTSSFAGTGDISLSSLVAPNQAEGAGIGLLALVAGAGVLATGALSIGIILSYAFVAFMFLLITFLILTFRQLLIIFLVVLAPLAILSWIFPGNDKLWKLWWGTFSKLLMMFPLIAGLIATGKVFAVVVNESDTEGVGTFIKLVAYIAPYFMIPATFKFAGGIFATVAGMANDKSRGLFDKQKKYRTEKMAENKQATLAGQRMSRNKLARGLSESYRRTKMGGLVPTKKGQAKYRAKTQQLYDQAAQEALKRDNMRAAGDDTATSLALQKGMNAQKFIQQYSDQIKYDRETGERIMDDDQAVKSAEAALQTIETSFGAKLGSNTMRLTAYKAKAASVTGYGAGDYEEMTHDAASLMNDGLLTTSDAAAAFKQNKARSDISGVGFGDWMKALEKAKSGQKNGLGKGQLLGDDAVADLKQKAIQGTGAYGLISQRKESVKALAPQMKIDLEKALESGDETAINQQLAQITAVYETMSSAAPQNAKIFRDEVISKKVSGKDLNVGQLIDNKRGDDGFQEFRREYTQRASMAAKRGDNENLTPAQKAEIARIQEEQNLGRGQFG